MSQPSVRAEIDAIEAKITAGLQEDRTDTDFRLCLSLPTPRGCGNGKKPLN